MGNQSQSRRFFGKPEFIGLIILIVVAGGLVADANKADNDNFYADIIRLDNIATKIHQSYVEEIASDKLVDKAVEGMLEILDPHTSFFKAKQYDELRIHTEGKFGGLGIQISIRDKILTVMTPISGTPAARAGIQSGDQIITIEGKSTKGISIDDAVSKLRGEPGTDVTITIRRKGENQDLDYTITREVIVIHAVPFYGMLDNKIGYMRLLSFSQDAGEEVEKAMKSLLKEDISGLILDLRYNPGGLLPQAIEVAEKFLERKALVVSTRGRLRGQNKEFFASSNPVLPKNMPMVVLVNAASASASEIVAGAIQDWDRGIVLGDTTFGKGSVQSILPLDNEHHLKLTTAFYYTPSGRCINKPENAIPESEDDEGYEGEEEAESEDTAKADSVAVDTTTYKTQGGRIVYGGGGIIPDTIVKQAFPEFAVQRLLIKDVFFKFANSVYPKMKKRKVNFDTSFVISDKIMTDFHEFLDSTDFDFSSIASAEFDAFRKRAGIADTVVDTTDINFRAPKWTDEERDKIKMLAADIEKLLDIDGKRAFNESEIEVKKLLKEAFYIRDKGQDSEIVYRSRLADDMQVKVAEELLRSKEAYARLLQPRAVADGRKKESKKK